MGRNPTPLAVLKARGSWKANVKVDEPQGEQSLPEKPGWLTGTASDIWDDLAPQLLAMGTLARCDRDHFARYCDFMGRYENARNKPGDMDLLRMIKLSEHIERLGRAMGLNASARSGLAKPKENTRENRGKTPFTKVGQHTA